MTPLTCALWWVWAAAGPARLAVLPVQLEPNADVPVRILNDAVLTATARASRHEVVGQDDLNALLSFEKQKELLGCDEVSCFAEIGGALGVESVLSMRVGFVNGEWVVTSKVIDTTTGKALHRGTEFVKGDAKDLLKRHERADTDGVLRPLCVHGGRHEPHRLRRLLPQAGQLPAVGRTSQSGVGGARGSEVAAEE